MANAGLRQVEIAASHAGTVHPVDVETRRRPSYFDVDARRSSRMFPWISCLFVVANVVVFIVTMSVNNCPKNTGDCVARFLGRFSFQPMRENPLLGPSSVTLLKMGALDVQKVVHENQGWRIIACIWLHGGVFHLLSNMLGLLFIGLPLEREFGFVRIGLLYIISGVGGSLLSSLFAESNISVGASGALFGLLGGMLSELIMNWTIYKNKFAAFTALVAIIAINLAVGLLPRVDNFAHIGGFMSGFLLGFIFLIRPHFGYINQKNLPSTYRPLSAARKHKLYQYILWILAAILLIIGFIVGFVLLYRGVDANKRCSWCRYLNCIPSSKWSCNQQAISCTINSDPFQMILTCDRTGKSHTYPPQNNTKEKINSLCAQLCS